MPPWDGPRMCLRFIPSTPIPIKVHPRNHPRMVPHGVDPKVIQKANHMIIIRRVDPRMIQKANHMINTLRGIILGSSQMG